MANLSSGGGEAMGGRSVIDDDFQRRRRTGCDGFCERGKNKAKGGAHGLYGVIAMLSVAA